MNKHKLKQSSKKKSYYDQQFAVTMRNKHARSVRRQRRKVDTLRRQMLKRLPHETRRHD